jgi:hypothetical protein
MLAIAAALSLMPAARLLGVTPDLTFPPQGQVQTQSFGPLNPQIDFNEAIVSWDVENPNSAALKIQARAIVDGKPTRWFTLGDWAGDTHAHPRQSLKQDADDDAQVNTDTLHLKKPGQQLEVSVEMSTVAPGPTPKLRLVTVAFADAQNNGSDEIKTSPAWGKVVEVPERAQGNYPNGGVLCSPTSVSMVLWHYSLTLNRPELNQDVPLVEAGVWDSVFKGAGNWPFNTAYAGGFDGMRAYVSRFNSISDLEKWIDAGLPVICSVSFDMLQGKPLSPQESGHLVVLVGFTPEGDPIFNDPAWKHHVRTTYKRADFEKAWVYSHRTVYLIYPEGANIPKNDDGLWLSN